MNLRNKKELAARTFEIGKDRISFIESRKEEIKEALTKQDMKDLRKDGAIIIKEIKGRKKNIKRKKRRTTGNIRKKVNKRKKEYVIITRKLRKYVKEIFKQDRVSKEEKKELRKKIRNRDFKNLAQLKRHITEIHR